MALVVVVLGWFVLFYLTPGLTSTGIGRLFVDDPATSVFIETLVVTVPAIGVVLLHPHYNRMLFAHSPWLLVYILPAVLAIALPFHYGLEYPVGLYMLWMTVSVFWQDYLTFGLLQSYLRERLPTAATVIIVGALFYSVHALTLPDKFAPTQLLPSLAILVLGLLLAVLRAKLKTMHVIIALHLSFYFLFA